MHDPHLPKHVFYHFIEFLPDRRAFDGSKEPVKNECKAHSSRSGKIRKAKYGNVSVSRASRSNVKIGLWNLREIEMHFRQKLFLKRLASSPCYDEIALTFKLPSLLVKMSAFTARSSEESKKINAFFDC